MVVLGYLPKVKRDLGLAFGAHFRINFKIYLGSTSKEWLTRRKRGEDGSKLEYFENEKSFLDEIKNIFHGF